MKVKFVKTTPVFSTRLMGILISILLAGVSMATEAYGQQTQPIEAVPAPLAETIQVAEIYNSHYDFVRKMHALDVQYLTQQGFAEPLPTDGVASLKYRIDLRGKNYVDPYGNRYDGVLEYAVTDAEDKVGTAYYLHFQNFSINEVKMRGSKLSVVAEMRGQEIARSCWTRCSPQQRNTFADAGYKFEPLQFELADGTAFSFTQTMKKEVVYDDFGRKITEITGDATLVVDGKGYEISLIEPTVVTAQCRWPETGVASVKHAGQKIADIVYKKSAKCSADYQLVMSDRSIVNVALRHGYWK